MAKYTIPELHQKLTNEGYVVDQKEFEDFILNGYNSDQLVFVRPRDGHVLRITNRSLPFGKAN